MSYDNQVSARYATEMDHSAPNSKTTEDSTFDAEDVAHQVIDREREKDALIDTLKYQNTELRKLIWQMYTGSN